MRASLEQQEQIVRAVEPTDLEAWGILDDLRLDGIEVDPVWATFQYNSSSRWVNRNTFLLRGVVRIKVNRARVGKSQAIEMEGGYLFYPFEAELRRADFPRLPPGR